MSSLLLSSKPPGMLPRGARGRNFGRLVAVTGLAALLPGCPLSDEYFVDSHAGLPITGSGAGGTSAAKGGSAGMPATGGSPAVGGTASGGGGTGGGTGGTTDAGRGGDTAASGGTGASG